MVRAWIVCGVVLGLVSTSRTSSAQLHVDVELEGGAEKRFLTGRPPLGEDPGLGPTFLLSTHVAVLPLLRAGAYVSHDISPILTSDTRQITAAGLSFRLLSPWPRGAFRGWLFANLGYAGAYAPSYVETLPAPSDSPNVMVQGTGGSFVETPLGIGGSFRFAQHWEVVVETGARIGFGFAGSMYNQGPTATSNGSLPKAQRPGGDDLLGVFIALGIAFEL